MTTQIIIRDFQGETNAFFPNDLSEGRYHTCYSHYGQHGSCDLRWCLENSTLPTKKDLQHLLNELVRVGYDDLELIAFDSVSHSIIEDPSQITDSILCLPQTVLA